ncbi:MAG: hydrogenase expression/formation protein HypE [Candidatus Altiarchaeota archaeon]
MDEEIVSLSEGSGGMEMSKLIASYGFGSRGRWRNVDCDSSTFDLRDGRALLFTTDSFVIDPLFFPGGDIGQLAACGTINDIAVMGGRPLGLSLGFVIEEGFPKKDLRRIVESIGRISAETGVPIATGDTKVMDRGKLDKMIINSSAVGIAGKGELLTKKPVSGDRIILSGGLGEHAVALLSKRFDYETGIVTDSKPLLDEIAAVKGLLKLAKDPTRGGMASVLNEICGKYGVGMLLEEETIPAKKEARTVTEMLGIDLYELASEGRFIAIAARKNAKTVEKRLKRYNPDAAIIGQITKGDKVVVDTMLGRRIMPWPTGRIVPRIC